MQFDHTARQAALALTALLALGSTARAHGQVGHKTKYFESINSFDLTSMGFAGTQGRIVHGDASGDLTGFMFFLLDGEVLWSPLPYSLTSVAPLSAPAMSVSDLVIARHSSGAKDVVLLSNDFGLVVAEYAAGTNDFTMTALPGTSIWADATQLKRHPEGPSGKTVISGLLNDGVTVRVSEFDELGETHQFSVPVPIEILSYDLIDYDVDGSIDVAFVNVFGLFVFSQPGFLLRREQVELVTGGVATFASDTAGASGGVDRLAFWFQDETTGEAHLRVIDGPVTEPNIELNLLPPSGLGTIDVLPSNMAVGDYNNDGHQDLLLQLHHNFCVLVTNQEDGTGTPPAEHFDVAGGSYDSISLDSNYLGSSNPGGGLAFFGNIDSDPGDDLLVPLDDLNRIEVLTRDGLLNGNGSGQEQFVGHSFGDLVTPQTTYYWDDVLGEARLNLALEIPLNYLPGGSQAFEFLQVVTWFQDGANQQLNLMGERNELHALNASTEFQWTPVLPLEQGSLLTGDYWPDRDNMWVVMRFVDADLNQQPFKVERASRFSIGAFTLRETESSPSVPEYLTLLAGAGPTVGLYFNDGPFNSPGGETSSNGSGNNGASGKNGKNQKGNQAGRAGHTGTIFGGGPTTANAGGGYVGAYVPQSSSVLFPPGDVPFFPGLANGGGMGDY